MERTREIDKVRRDAKGRILPPNVTYRSKQEDYMWRKTYRGVSYPPVYDKNLASLKRRIPQIESDIYNGNADRLKSQALTLNNFFDGMMRDKGNIKDVTKVNYEKYWNRHVRSGFGDKLAKEISKEELRNKYRKLLSFEGANLCFGTVKVIHSLIYGSYAWGMDNDKVTKNIAENALRGFTHEKSDGEHALTEEEENIFFNYVDNHKYFKYHKELLHMMRNYGLRAGEAIGLCEDALDFNKGAIKITRALNYKDNVGNGKKQKYFSSTKSECSNRTLPFIKNTEKSLKEHMRRMRIIGRNCVECVDGHKDFIFITQKGTAYTVDYLNQLLHRIVDSYNKQEEEKARKEEREAVYLEHFSSHAFRHTFAQRLMNQGVREEFIRDWLGHSDTRTTQIYAKPSWENLKNTLPDCLK